MNTLRLFPLLLVAVVASACSDSTDTGSRTAAAEPVPATATTTGATQAAQVTFTGTECTNSGADTLSSSDINTMTVRNDSAVDMVMVVLKLSDITLEDLVADDVRIFPLTEIWPPPGAEPKELHTFLLVEPGSEKGRPMAFVPGEYGTVCYPIDGSPALQGGLLTVE